MSRRRRTTRGREYVERRLGHLHRFERDTAQLAIAGTAATATTEKLGSTFAAEQVGMEHLRRTLADTAAHAIHKHDVDLCHQLDGMASVLHKRGTCTLQAQQRALAAIGVGVVQAKRSARIPRPEPRGAKKKTKTCSTSCVSEQGEKGTAAIGRLYGHRLNMHHVRRNVVRASAAV